MGSLTLVSTLAACGASVPTKPGDACAIFDQNRGWYRDTRKSYERWGIDIPTQLAIIRQESGFRHDARPPRRKILWIFPGPRPSTAYGYAQALTSTWREYQRATGRRGADRDDFEDAADFIGWYGARSARVAAISKSDTFGLYLAYHEGDGGYRRGTYRRKGWLVGTARRVEERARTYRRQLAACEKRFQRLRFLGIF